MSYDASFKFNPFSDGTYYHSLSLFVEALKSSNGTIKYCVCTSFYDYFVPACVSPIFDNVESAFDFAEFLSTQYPDLETDEYPWGDFDLYPIFDKKLMEVNSNENK